VETPYFVVPPEVAKVYGEKPTELKVKVPVNSLDVVFPRAYKYYGSSRGLKGTSLIEKYAGKKCLILDDLGVEKTTEWSLQTLYTIIDRRYREEKQTLITSNLTLDEIAEKVGDRIASRIAGMCKVVEIKGRDRRLKG
jgi:DNA replication protein DnaC